MAQLSKAQLKTKLNTRLRDADDTTWTSAEKDEILSEAINDPYVYMVDRDDTITTTENTASYPVPAGFDDIYDLYIDYEGDGFGTHIDRSAYDIINGNLYFTHAYRSLASSKTLIMYGKKKLTDTDLFPELLQDYVLHLAIAAAFEMLKTSLTSRFIKNDITMSEIINSINTHKAEAARLRASIINQRVVTL